MSVTGAGWSLGTIDVTSVIVGIDPGQTGAIAMLDATGGLLAVHDMPYIAKQVAAPLVAGLLRDIDTISSAWVERAQSMPGMGRGSAFTYGTGYGVVLGVLGALHVPTETVRPTEWKRSQGLGGTGKDKAASRRRAIELWPAWANFFERVKDDGRAEAALIARHGWMQHREMAA